MILRLLFLLRLINFAIITIIVLAFVLPYTPDGTYVPETFNWEGGDGSVTLSCNEVMVYDGEVTARIVFNTRDYAYVKVDDEEYKGSYTRDSSVFNIPVLLDEEMTITGCTAGDPKPNETEYTIFLTVDDSGRMPERVERIRESAVNILGHVTSGNESEQRHY